VTFSFEKTLYRWFIAAPAIALPLLLGGVQARTWLWMASIFFIGMGIIFWSENTEFLKGFPSRRGTLILGLLLLYPFLQSLSLPLSWLACFSPHRLLWLEGAETSVELSFPAASISYIPLQTFFRGLWWLFLVCYGLCFHRFIQNKEDYPWFFRIIFILTVLEACYGLLQATIPSLGVLWEQGTFFGSAYKGYARGTFVNRNHFAAFMGLMWPVLLAYILNLERKLKRKKRKNPRKNQTSTVWEEQLQIRQQQIFMAFLIGLVILSLVFSQSRGGIIASLIALSLFLLFAGVRERKIVLFVSGCWFVMFLYGSILGFDALLIRFDYLAGSASGRFHIWKDTLSIVQDHPLTGTGLGSYATVFEIYQAHLLDTQEVTNAHNDYLELASELGLPVTFLLVGWVWGYWWRKALTLWRSRNRLPSEERLMGAGTLAGIAAFLIHCLVDFNWQIPACQLYFVMLLVLLSSAVNDPAEKKAVNRD
jgi:O-antigen ligase